MVVLTMTKKGKNFAYIVVNALNTKSIGATYVVSTSGMRIIALAALIPVRNVERIKMSIEELMPFFSSLSVEAQTKAYENLAYQLLDNYIDSYGGSGDEDMVEERLMDCLSNEKQYQDEYKRWEQYNARP
jgi:hypothetical protein